MPDANRRTRSQRPRAPVHFSQFESSGGNPKRKRDGERQHQIGEISTRVTAQPCAVARLSGVRRNAGPSPTRLLRAQARQAKSRKRDGDPRSQHLTARRSGSGWPSSSTSGATYQAYLTRPDAPSPVAGTVSIFAAENLGLNGIHIVHGAAGAQNDVRR